MDRIEREKHIVELMIRIWCRKKHSPIHGAPCKDCRQLLDYAMARLDYCPHGDTKPTCRRCRIHCYRPEMREKIRQVMRYVGPRMIFLAPREAFLHILH